MSGLGSQLDDELIAAIFADRFGWTYEQYSAQPLWFIKLLLMKGGIDAEEAKRQSSGKSV